MNLKRCSFCMKSEGLSGLKEEWDPEAFFYKCPRCGPIYLGMSAGEIVGENALTEKEKKIVSIVLLTRQ